MHYKLLPERLQLILCNVFMVSKFYISSWLSEFTFYFHICYLSWHLILSPNPKFVSLMEKFDTHSHTGDPTRTPQSEHDGKAHPQFNSYRAQARMFVERPSISSNILKTITRRWYSKVPNASQCQTPGELKKYRITATRNISELGANTVTGYVTGHCIWPAHWASPTYG